MFVCRFCSYQSIHWPIYFNHLQKHLILSDKYHCGYERCPKFFRTKDTLRVHLLRCHKLSVRGEAKSSKFKIVPNVDVNYVCQVQLCGKLFANSNHLLKHMKNHIKEGTEVMCPVSNCTKKYCNVQSFTGHLSKYHRSYQNEMSHNDKSNPKLSIDNSNEENIEEIASANNFLDANDVNDMEFCQVDEEFDSSELFLQNLSNFYLKLESEFAIPASTIQKIVTDFQLIAEQANDISNKLLKERLIKENIATDKIYSILHELSLSNPFLLNSMLKTDFKRKFFYKNNNNYVPPKQILIKEVNGKKQYFHYIPIEDTLKDLMKNKSLGDITVQVTGTGADVLDDFEDGLMYQNNNYIRKYPDAIKIILYQDSFEVVNPIGSAKQKYKVLAVYLTVGNLPSHVRNNSNFIQLVALCREKWFDHDKVYGRIVCDLKKLESDGVKFDNGNVRKVGLIYCRR